LPKTLSRRQFQLLANGAEALLAGIAIGMVIYAGVETASSYMKNYDFAQAVRKEAQLAATDSRPADTIREEIIEKSQDLGLIVSRESITVVSTRKDAQIPIAGLTAIVANGDQNDLPTVGSVSIDVSYAISIPFPLHTFNLNFHCHGDDHTI
jgi:hypothetical protein